MKLSQGSILFRGAALRFARGGPWGGAKLSQARLPWRRGNRNVTRFESLISACRDILPEGVQIAEWKEELSSTFEEGRQSGCQCVTWAFRQLGYSEL